MTLERKKEILEKDKPKLDRTGALFLFEEINLFITITPANSVISYRIKPQKAGSKTTILSSNLNRKLRWSKISYRIDPSSAKYEWSTRVRPSF